MRTKTTALLLILALAFSVMLAACSESGSDVSKEESKADDVSEAGSAAEESSEEVSKLFIDGLDPAGLDLDGYAMRFLVLASNIQYDDEQIIGYTESTGEDKADDVIAAIVERNNKMTQEYGFVIESESVTSTSDFPVRVRSDNEAGIANYEAIVGGAYYLAPLSAEGMFYDFYDLEGSLLSLDEVWWDPVTQKDMTIVNSLYLATGDLLYTDDNQTRCLFFNKDLIKEYNLANPFDLVNEGKWTLDEMYTMMKAVAHTGGDGLMNVAGDDTWGMVGVSFDTYMLIMGGGIAQIVKDENDVPRFAMMDEQNVNNFFKVFDIVSDREATCFTGDYYRWNDSRCSEIYAHFYNGQALFYPEVVGKVNSEKMREADINYGILPMPKMIAEQDNYASTVNPYGFGTVAIPVTIDEDEIPEITFCLEAMARYDNEHVTAVYYDLTLKLKRLIDDEDSPEMLDLIFRNRIVDMSVMFNWADCIQYYNQLRSNKNRNVVSFCQSKENAFNAAMEATVENYNELKNH